MKRLLIIIFITLIGVNVMSSSATPPENINAEQAKQIATTAIQSIANGHDFVIVSDQTIERPFGWVFFYTTRQYLETDNPSYIVPGNGPLIVLSSDGSHEWLSTAMPPQKAIEVYEKKWIEGQI